MNGLAIVSVSVAVPVPPELVALSVTKNVPVVIGVPEIRPEARSTLSPLGSPLAL